MDHPASLDIALQRWSVKSCESEAKIPGSGFFLPAFLAGYFAAVCEMKQLETMDAIGRFSASYRVGYKEGAWLLWCWKREQVQERGGTDE